MTKKMLFWASEAHVDPALFEKYLAEKVLAKPFPGVVGPSLWNEKSLRTYILDGHHRASAIFRIFFDNYPTLPDAVKAVLSPERQALLRASPQMKIRVQVEARYQSVSELVKSFAVSGRGQLPTAVRSDPAFSAALRSIQAGEKNFDVHALIAARGLKITPENAISPELTREVSAAVMEDKEVVRFLETHSRPGHEAENKAMMEKALGKYFEEKAAAARSAACLENYQQLGAP